MAIIENKDIYDESQGLPLQSVVKVVEFLDEKIKGLNITCQNLEKTLLDVNKTGSGGEAQQLIENTQKLAAETEKLTALEKAKIAVEKQMEVYQQKYLQLMDDNAKAVKAMQVETQNLNQKRTLEAKLASETTNALTKYKLELKEAKAAILSNVEGSKEYTAAMRKAADMTFEMKEIQEKVRGTSLNYEQVTKNIVGVVGGLSKGYEVAVGVQELFGSGNEELAKKMVKLQAAIALAHGLEGLDGLGKAFGNLLTQIKTFASGMNKALLATGIGAFVVIIASLVAYWDDIKTAMFGVSAEQKRLNTLAEEKYKTSKKELETLNDQDNIMKLQGKSEKQILEYKLAQIRATIKDAEARIESMAQINKLQVDAESRNNSILQKALTPTTMILKLINNALIQMGKFIGKDWDLHLGDLTKTVSSQIFDPEETKKKGEETLEAARTELNKLKNEEAGFQLQIKEIDKKASTDFKKNEEEKRKEIEKTFDLSGKLAAKNLEDQIKKAERIKKINEDLAKKDEENLAAEKERQELNNQWYIDAKKAQVAEEEKLEKEKNDLITGLVESSLGQLMDLAVQGQLTFKSFQKVILSIAYEALKKMILTFVTRILGEQLATKGFFGFGTAAALTAPLTASVAVAGAAISSFAKGTDYVNGPGTETSDSVPARLSRGERVIPAHLNKQLLGIANKDLPSVVNAGLNFYRMETLLSKVDKNTSETAFYVGNGQNNWIEIVNGKEWFCTKDWRSNSIIRRPK